MKTKLFILFLSLIINKNVGYSQEWKSLNAYKKETGHTVLQEGCWLKKDRKRQTQTWKEANLYNISSQNGNLKYKTIRQIRDFYSWFALESEKQGHEIKWFGIAQTVANQLSKLDSWFIKCFIIRNKEVVDFANEGSVKVFEFAFPQLKNVYFSKDVIKGATAENWDVEYGTKEQCEVLEPLYQKLSTKALWKLDRMAKGKGIFSLAVSNDLKYVGSIEDCHARFEHGMRIYSVNQNGKKLDSINNYVEKSP